MSSLVKLCQCMLSFSLANSNSRESHPTKCSVLSQANCTGCISPCPPQQTKERLGICKLPNLLTLSYSSCDANRSRCILVIYRTSVSGRAASRLSNFSWEIPLEAINWTMWFGMPRLGGLTQRICTLYRVSNLTRTNATLSVSFQSNRSTCY